MNLRIVFQSFSIFVFVCKDRSNDFLRSLGVGPDVFQNNFVHVFPSCSSFFTVEKIRMASKVLYNTKIVFYVIEDFDQQ